MQFNKKTLKENNITIFLVLLRFMTVRYVSLSGLFLYFTNELFNKIIITECVSHHDIFFLS